MAQAESLPLDLQDIRVRLRRLPRFDVAAPGDDVPEG